MNTLISRLFTKGATTPTHVAIAESDQQYHEILRHFYNKGYTCDRLSKLALECDEFDFSDDDEQAFYELVKLFLAIEHYLLKVDAGYIGSTTEIRSELKTLYPQIATTPQFILLFDEGNTQELRLGLLFCDFLHKRLLNQVVRLRTEEPKRSSLAQLNIEEASPIAFIGNRRKIREYINTLVTEYTQSQPRAYVSVVFEEFKSFYKHLTVRKQLDYFLPDGFGKTSNTENPSNQSSEPQILKPTLPDYHQDLSLPAIPDTYKSILENLLDLYFLVRSDGTILEANSAACKTLGIKNKELSKHSLLEYLPSDFATAFAREMADTEHKIPKKIIGRRQDIELKTRKDQDSYFEISITNNYTDAFDTYSILLKNITQTREAISSAREAKESAQRAAQAKSTFLSNMSHEIRTPLNVILGLSDILKKSDNSDATLFKKNIDGIDFSARNLLSIVNDILDFSKIEAGKLSIQAYDYNIKEVITSLTDGFAIKAREKGVDVITHIDNDLPDFIVGDQYRLNQILTNLIGNALKFTEAGTITVIVRKETGDKSSSNLYFEVKDTGIGILPEKLERIFDSFYQVEGSENSKITGTGLGLTITKQLIELQQGTLQAKSVRGEGSSFFFTLPLTKSTTQADEKKAIQKEKSVKDLKGMRVLVAEDNKMNQFYIEQLLNRLDIEVDIAENGKEAVDIYNQKEKGHYNLVLMDMHMPIMNGTEAISQIRKSHKDAIKKVPIVACSADVFPEARKDAMKAGIDFYLTKPLSEEALKEVLFWLISDDGGELSIKNPQDTTRSNKVDIEGLREALDGDDDFIVTLLEVFIAETPDDYNSLRTCMEREFYTRAHSLAHKMKSSFMNLGMKNHGYHLQQIESNVNQAETIAIAQEHWKQFQPLYTKALLDVNLLMIELKGN